MVDYDSGAVPCVWDYGDNKCRKSEASGTNTGTGASTGSATGAGSAELSGSNPGRATTTELEWPYLVMILAGLFGFSLGLGCFFHYAFCSKEYVNIHDVQLLDTDYTLHPQDQYV